MTSITCVYTCHYQNKDLAIFDVFDYFNPSISNGSNRFFYFQFENYNGRSWSYLRSYTIEIRQCAKRQIWTVDDARALLRKVKRLYLDLLAYRVGMDGRLSCASQSPPLAPSSHFSMVVPLKKSYQKDIVGAIVSILLTWRDRQR